MAGHSASGKTEGYVFATSGGRYAELATNAAKSLRAVSHNANIDLFTDADDVEKGVFDQVIPLEKSWFRPKFEALRKSRFDKTIYLDADMIILADISDIFQVLDRFELAAVHSARRNGSFAREIWKKPMPNAFPQINGGLLAARKDDKVYKLFEDIEEALVKDNLDKDQVPMRELLFDSDIRLAILPPEYNLMHFRMIDPQNHKFTAPRVLHMPRLYEHFKRGLSEVTRPDQIIGPGRWRQIQKMIRGDVTLGGQYNKKLRPFADQGPLGWGRWFLVKLSIALAERRK